jgi:hypothetical protein
MRASLLLLGLLPSVLLGGGASAGDDEAKKDAAPPEPRKETLHGLEVTIYEPKAKPEGGYSLMVFLHGFSNLGAGPPAADSHGREVGRLVPLLERGFVLAGPWSKSKDGNWATPDVRAVREIAKDLIARYEVARERRHCAGFWGGADGLPEIAFEEDLGFRTATWIDFAWGGGSVPKWAKEELNGLFLWGANEGPSRVPRYRKACSLLSERVKRSVEHGLPQEPGLGRARADMAEFPAKALPFWAHFLVTMEGRFEPGREESFAWAEDLATARAAMEQERRAGFAYVYSGAPGPEERERTRDLQRDVFFDRAVRHFAEQIVAVKIEKAAAKDLLAEAGVEETPAVIVWKRGGRAILRSVSGKIETKALVPILRAVAPDQELPK